MARGIIARSCISKSTLRLLLLGMASPPAAAHGFGQRFDLPLPLWLWVAGVGATIVLTFVVIALFVRERRFGSDYPRVNLPRFGAMRRVGALVRFLVALVFILTVGAGFFGLQDAYRNLITTMVWVVWWVGFAFVCALIGDLWALVNPLRTLFAWAEALCGRSLSLGLPYPAWLGAWPAVALFLGFAWAELVWRDNDVPAYLACAVLGYAVVTWIGMFLYGREPWLRNGEAFSIAFGVLGRFAPLQAFRGQLYLRPPGAGLMTDEPVRMSFLFSCCSCSLASRSTVSSKRRSCGSSIRRSMARPPSRRCCSGYRNRESANRSSSPPRRCSFSRSFSWPRSGSRAGRWCA